MLYADDILLVAKSEAELQILIHALETWCNTWKLRVNVTKTNVLHFRGPKKKRTTFNFEINNEPIEIVSMYKYLGFYLHELSDFNIMGTKMTESGNRALGNIIGKFKVLNNISYSTFTQLYNSNVASILDYDSEIWGFCKAPQCERLQQRAIQYFLGVHKFCPVPALTGDMGWASCKIRRKLNMLKYWNRLLSLPDNSITKCVFLNDYQLNYKNWSNEIENILDEINMTSIFQNKTKCNIELAKCLLLKEAEKSWLTDCRSKPKLRTYILYKNNFSPEPYVTQFLSRKQRSLLAQLRCGILPIKIETGRFLNHKDIKTGKYKKLKIEERICDHCNTGMVEDEIHFVFCCPLYETNREKLYTLVKAHNNKFDQLLPQDKLIYLLKNHVKYLCIFLSQAWDQRTESLYKKSD